MSLLFGCSTAVFQICMVRLRISRIRFETTKEILPLRSRVRTPQIMLSSSRLLMTRVAKTFHDFSGRAKHIRRDVKQTARRGKKAPSSSSSFSLSESC
jgi:hypothetical protein